MLFFNVIMRIAVILNYLKYNILKQVNFLFKEDKVGFYGCH